MKPASLNHLFENTTPISVLDTAIQFHEYVAIDLSTENLELDYYDISEYQQCQTYIDTVLKRSNGKVAFGGYLEKRNIYNDKSGFNNIDEVRNIHLGIDFWAPAGTKVLAPLDGEVHSFQNNSEIGDYGPTIILKHDFKGQVFHTLYGHLSISSLANLQVGKQINKGTDLAALGTPDINVNYAPHLHFQIVLDMEGKKGDYPGVCSESKLDFYQKNCPNPSILLHI